MVFILRFALILLTLSLAWPSAAAVSTSDAYLPDEILVQFKPNGSSLDLGRVQSLLGTYQPLAFRSDVLQVYLKSGMTVPRALALVKALGDVALAQPDYRYQLFQSCAPPAAASDAYFTSGVIPSPACGVVTGNGNVNWPYLLVNAPSAWAQLGANLACPSANPVTVAVLDSGVASDYSQTRHPDLPSSLFIPGYNSSGDWGGDTTDTVDNHGHGTMVAGILAAQWNNAGGTNACTAGTVPAGSFNGGTVGVAGYPGLVKIMPVKGADSTGSLTTGTVVEGIYYAVLHGAKVINMSLGTTANDPLEGQAVTFALNQGCVVVAAVGNAGNGVPLSYPAAFPGVIGVGAVGPADTVTSYTQTGAGMGMVAPGGALVSLFNTFDTADNFFGCILNCPSPTVDTAFQVDPCDNNYAVASGTSLAAPMVAGAAALLFALNPTLANTQVVQILENTAHQIIGAPGTYNQTSGWGRLDLNAAVLSALALGAQPALTITPTPFPATATPTPAACLSQPGAFWSPQTTYDLQSVGGAVFDVGDGNGPRPFELGGGALSNPITIAHWIPAMGWSLFGTSQAPLLNRIHYNVAAFKNYIWVLGGLLNGATYQNDTWFSFDGFHYNLGTSNAGFAGRLDFGSAVFQNNLWVLCGQTASGLTNDAWSSSDGSSWSAAATPPFSARKGLAVVAFNNRLWVLGGQTAGGVTNDVWSTGDGINWTQSNPTTPGAIFSPRAYHLAVVCANSIWVMGGQTASGPVSDVWVSQDGANWTQTLAQTPFGPVSQFAQVSLSYEGQVWSVGASGSYTSNCCALSTLTPTGTPTFTPTATPTITLSPTATWTPTPSLTPTLTFSPTMTSSPTVSPTPTITMSPTPSPTLGPVEVTLGPPYPNPVSTGGNVYFDVQAPGNAVLSFDVFTTAFRKIGCASFPISGKTTLSWNLRDHEDLPVANGLYYLRVRVKGSQSFSQILKVLVLR